ncbi:MAG: tRNA-dihydrouridine synthase family protein [Bacteriovoracia bacterium]
MSTDAKAPRSLAPIWVRAGRPELVLAPMEGVTDAPMRALLTELGGFTFCVSEFLRVSQELLPPRIYVEHVPELAQGCRTPSGVPIQVQLLGGDEDLMARSALRACDLGARAIDINFGCPSKTVNRHDGGAALLRHPSRIRSIVAAVRAAVPATIPVSAKLRLGWESMEDIYVNAEQAVLGGADWLTIHARTKKQGYIPPAHWAYIGELRRRLGDRGVPIVANGEIWTREDFLRCREATGCEHFMIGRGALGDPALAHEMARELGLPIQERSGVPGWGAAPYPFPRRPRDWEPLLARFAEITSPVGAETYYTACRIKQWLRFATVRGDLPWFEEVKRIPDLPGIFAYLRA